MRRAILGAVLALLGCSGGGDDNDPELEGTWAFTDAAGCLIGFTFKGDGYEGDEVCNLQGGGIGLEAQLGMYAATEKVITFMPTTSSCPNDSPEPVDIGYELVGTDTLRLASRTRVAVFKRQKPSVATGGTGGTARFGCWGSDGSFTPSELTNL